MKNVRLIAILVLMLGCMVPRCWAQDDVSFGTWMAITGTHKFGDSDFVQLRTEWRTQDNCTATNQVYGRLRYGHKFTKWLELDMFGDYAWTPSGDRWRYGPAMQLSWKTGPVGYNLREWWFRTYTPTKDETSDTMRTKLTVTWQRDGAQPYVAGEYFSWPWDGLSQWRAFAGSKFALGDASTLNVFYLYQAFPPRGVARNILGVGWVFNI